MATLHDQLYEFNSLWKETDAIYRKLASQSNLSDSSYWVLYALYESDDYCSQKNICDQWSMSKQTVNSALQELIKKRLIFLEISTSDHRSKRIVLTESGRIFASKIFDIIFQLEESTLMEMSDADRIAMLQSLRNFLKIFREKSRTILCKAE